VIETLESASLLKPLAVYEPAGAWMWLRNQYYLQKLYRENGQTADESRIRQELQEALVLADPGHPFLQSLD
jgi:hypothetical protein